MEDLKMKSVEEIVALIKKSIEDILKQPKESLLTLNCRMLSMQLPIMIGFLPKDGGKIIITRNGDNIEVQTTIETEPFNKVLIEGKIE